MQQNSLLRGLVDDVLYGSNAKSLTGSEDGSYKFASGNDLAEFVFYSQRKPRNLAVTRLRRQIYEKLKDNTILLKQGISDVIHNFVKELPKATKGDKMYGVFTCKCGWLLHDPTTLQCGHTLCKHCVEENMFCLHCGVTLTGSCNASPLLVDVLSTWFESQYESTGFKIKAKDFFSSGKFTDALLNIDKAIQLVAEDFTALNLRGETYINLKKFTLALQDAELSCKINNLCGKSHYIRAHCFLAINNFDHAMDSFQLSLEMDPEDGVMCTAVISSISEVFAADVCKNINDTRKKLSELSNFDYFDEDDTCLLKSKTDDVCKNINDTRKKLSELSNFDYSDEDDTCLLKSKTDDLPCEYLEKWNSSRNQSDENLLTTASSSSVQHSKTCSYSDMGHKRMEDMQMIHGVPANLINEDIFECKLCYDLLFRPVTLRCGHVFCKNCVAKTMDYNALCPVCRLELADYLKNPLKPVTIIIEDILQLYLKEQFVRRREEHEDQMQKLSKVGIDDSVDHPIFVCSTALPNVECPLHVFEPRYRHMIRQCIESGGLRFGMCCPQVDVGYSVIGTILTITHYEVLDDGRFIIRTHASKRFVCTEKSVVESLDYAKVKYFQDDEEDVNNDTFLSTARSTYDDLSSYIGSLQASQRDCLFNALGALPPYEVDVNSHPDGLPWIWWGLAALPLNFNAKLVLLGSRCVSKRLESLQRFLRFLAR